MSNVEPNTEITTNVRKISDILLSLEEKIVMLAKTISASDMNNKLILDRLNKLVNQGIQENKNMEERQISSVSPLLEISQVPTAARKQPLGQQVAPSIVSTPSPHIPGAFKPTVSKISSSTAKDIKKNKEPEEDEEIKKIPTTSKIPVGQCIVDNEKRSIFMADVIITNVASSEVVARVKTTAVGKWQAYLPIGSYSVKVSKITDPNTMNKIEFTQQIEVLPGMKSLQLPIATMNR